MSYNSVLLTFGLCPYGWHAMVSLQRFSRDQRPQGCSFPSFSPWAVLGCTVPNAVSICSSHNPFYEWANPNKGCFVRWSMWSEEKIFSIKQCKAISLEASMKGEQLLIGGRETGLNTIAYWVLAVRFIFVHFFSAPAAGRVICSCFPLCRMLSGVSDNLWKQTLAFQTWTKVSDAAGTNSHTTNHSLIRGALE